MLAERKLCRIAPRLAQNGRFLHAGLLECAKTIYFSRAYVCHVKITQSDVAARKVREERKLKYNKEIQVIRSPLRRIKSHVTVSALYLLLQAQYLLFFTYNSNPYELVIFIADLPVQEIS